MNEFRSDLAENQDDLLAYIDKQEYSDFRECPDHALALLQFAEKFELRELWTDAFVHCAGMNNDLASSGEFEVGGFLPAKTLSLIGHSLLHVHRKL